MGKRRKSKTRRQRNSRVTTQSENGNNIVKIDGETTSVKQPSYLSSGDLIGSNEDLLRNILIHVSDKPLSRFKLVSKLWLSIISDPDFSLRWHTKQIPSPSALICRRYSSHTFIPLDDREKNSFGPNFDFGFLPFSDYIRSTIQILQSCNGLLLLKVREYYHPDFSFAVYNPTTNQLKLTPKLAEKYTIFPYTILAFDPLKSPHYKLFSVLETFYMRIATEIYIYASEIGFWKVVYVDEDSLFHTIKYKHEVILEGGVFWNGAIHWPSRRNSSIYFDVDKECFMELPLPPIQGGKEKRTIRYFGESGGHLLFIDYDDDSALHFDVFEMEMDYSTWFVKYSVDLIALCWRMDAVNLRIPRFTFLTLIVNGDKVKGEEESPILVMYVRKNQMVISYNLKNEELKNLCSLSLNLWDLSICHFIRLPTSFL